MTWQPISTLPQHKEALVCVTHNMPGDLGEEWETVMWVDSWDDELGWSVYPRLIEVPFPPTYWQPLPKPPLFSSAGEEE